MSKKSKIGKVGKIIINITRTKFSNNKINF